ncbi:hypothetical protein HGM15179_006081 [Zosterops borbonicus]|uniref:Uncharacterized protein n=1 Tax=Zosterops borbonicus TaxID=364589 RepID=A0A8K1GLA2_9PASS|nr:hypothetical protein HGM15179_006081 [Zosterops borbonicus]
MSSHFLLENAMGNAVKGFTIVHTDTSPASPLSTKQITSSQKEIRNNCVFLYHDRDYLAYFGFDPVPTEVKGNPSVDVKWEQNQSQGLQKQNTKAEAPSCPN